MTKLYLVRHGAAAARWNEDVDPGLSELGWRQAETVAEHFLSGAVQPIYSSPLLRARETAKPLAASWNLQPHINPAFTEIPAPTGYSLQQRMKWLLEIRNQSWDACSDELWLWRVSILNELPNLADGCIVFTHFMVMNAVVAEAKGCSDLVCYQPDNGSILEVELLSGTLAIVDLGKESKTPVL